MLAGVLAAADSYSTQAAADPKYDGSQVYSGPIELNLN